MYHDYSFTSDMNPPKKQVGTERINHVFYSRRISFLYIALNNTVMDTCMQIISRILCPNFPLICVLNTHEKEEEKKGEKNIQGGSEWAGDRGVRTQDLLGSGAPRGCMAKLPSRMTSQSVRVEETFRHCNSCFFSSASSFFSFLFLFLLSFSLSLHSILF